MGERDEHSIRSQEEDRSQRMSSPRYNPKIVVDGYRFSLKRVLPLRNGARWVCTNNVCSSWVETGPDGSVANFGGSHQHMRPRQNLKNIKITPLGSSSLYLDYLSKITSSPVDSAYQQVPQSGGGGQVGQSPGGGSPGPAPLPPVKKAVSAPPPPPVAPPEVCLRWNSYHSNMQATFPSLLNNEQFVDVTLACEGRSIKCHKVMLSACSSYFEELLSQNPCQHPIIFMRDLKFWEVQALVEFMYTGEVNVAQDKLPSLLTAAEALQIKGLTNPGGGGGGSSGSYAASQEEDSNTTPEIDDVSSPSYCPPQKKIRKRKATNPTSYHQKAQAVYSPITQQNSPISSPMVHQAPPGLTPMRVMGQHTLGIIHQMSASHPGTQAPAAAAAAHPASQPRPSQARLKKEPGSPQHSYMPPSHTPFTPIIKSEPDDNMDTLLDLSESESRKESNAAQPHQEPLSLATNDQGPSSNGSQTKVQDNGLSEEDEPTGSECSESQGMHIDPGEASDA